MKIRAFFGRRAEHVSLRLGHVGKSRRITEGEISYSRKCTKREKNYQLFVIVKSHHPVAGKLPISLDVSDSEGKSPSPSLKEYCPLRCLQLALSWRALQVCFASGDRPVVQGAPS